MESSSYEHSAHYDHIDDALRAQWPTFTELEQRMAAFVPQPRNHFAPARENEMQRLRTLNPGASDADLSTFVDRQIDVLASPEYQFHENFGQRLMNHHVIVVMLSHALCEAIINAVLAIGLAHAKATDLFPILERTDLGRKWISGPKTFAAEYSFPTGSGLNESLTNLIRQRNALVHQKIDLRIHGQRILKGTSLDWRGYDHQRRWLRRYFSLPYDLSAFATDSIRGFPLLILFDRRPIEAANEHRRR